MAIITSVKNGQWTAASTWDLNRLPVASDDIIIATGHTVTAYNNFISEKSLSIYGTLDYQGELQTGNGVGKDCAFFIGPGGVLIVDSWWYCDNGSYTITGSSDNWAVIRGSGRIDGNLMSPSPRTKWECKYLSLQVTNQIILPSSSNTGSEIPGFNFQNCVFDGYILLVFGTSGSNGTPALCDWVFEACDFRGSGRVSMFGNSSAPTGLRRMRNCTFRSISTSTRGTLTTTTAGPWDFTGSVAINHLGSAGGSFATSMRWDRAFLADDISYSPRILIQTYQDSYLKNSFVHTGPTGPSSNAPSAVSIPVVDKCVFEVIGVDVVACTAALGLSKSVCSNNLFIVNGDAFAFSGTYTTDAEAYSNTVVRVDSSAGSLISLRNGRVTDSTALGTKVRNNLHAGVVPVDNMVRIFNTTNTLTINSNYNCTFNTTTPYPSTKFINKISPVNDIAVNPQFLDSSRRFEKWVQAVTSNPSSTYKDGYDLMANKNGYDASSKTQKATSIPAATLSDLIEYLYEGFTPTNMTLLDTGEGGTFIGALEPSNPVVHDYAVAISPTSASVTVGSSLTLTAILTDAGVPAENETVTWSIVSGSFFGSLTPSGLVTDAAGKTTAVLTGTLAGSTVVKAEFKTVSYQVNVTVKDVPVPSDDSLSFTKLEYKKFENEKLTWTKY